MMTEFLLFLISKNSLQRKTGLVLDFFVFFSHTVQVIFSTAAITMTTATVSRVATPPPVAGTVRTATETSTLSGPKAVSYCTLEFHSRRVISKTALYYGL